MAVELNNTTSANWNETDASNTATPPDGAPAGIFPNTSEGIWRGIMATVKRSWDRLNQGNVTVGGTANAITLVYSNTSYPTAYVQGEIYQFKATAANTGPTTVNINSVGNKNLFQKGTSGVTALVGGEIQLGDNVMMSYDGTQLQLLSGLPGSTFTPSSVSTLTNKTLDTAGSGNVFKIAGTQITAISGNTAKVATTFGSLTSGNLASFDASGNVQDSGASYVGPTSWTPVMNFGGSTSGITYSTQTGSYVKIGKFIIAELNIVLTSTGAASGSATITGLPFAAAGTGVAVASIWNYASVSGSYPVGSISGTTISLTVSPINGGTPNTSSQATLGGSAQLKMTCTYITV